MNYAQVFQDSYGSIPHVVRAIAQGMDEQEDWLERVRIKLGFREDWSPAYDRRMRSGVSAAIKWAEKAGGMNGMGDVRAVVEEMCGWMDLMETKKAEILAKLEPPLYDAADHGVPEIPKCPKCGKTGRGLAMHVKSCGKAA